MSPLHFERECISIHSLVKRETRVNVCSGRTLDDFNPLPRKEGDTARIVANHSGQQFQSTPS